MKTGTKRKQDPARPINFSPGALLGKFIDDYQSNKKLENRQEALRQIVRERMQQEEATA